MHCVVDVTLMIEIGQTKNVLAPYFKSLAVGERAQRRRFDHNIAHRRTRGKSTLPTLNIIAVS